MISFVEDRLATLQNVIKEPELDGWNLYLGKFFVSSFSSLSIVMYFFLKPWLLWLFYFIVSLLMLSFMLHTLA